MPRCDHPTPRRPFLALSGTSTRAVACGGAVESLVGAILTPPGDFRGEIVVADSQCVPADPDNHDGPFHRFLEQARRQIGGSPRPEGIERVACA